LEHEVGVDAADTVRRVAVDISASGTPAGLINLAIAKVREVWGRHDLGHAVSVPVEHVDTERGLVYEGLSEGHWKRYEEREHGGRPNDYPLVLSLQRDVVKRENIKVDTNMN
jgi:hypothetical protein